MILASAVIRALPMSVVMTVLAEYPWSDASMVALAVIRSMRMFALALSQPDPGGSRATRPMQSIWLATGIIVPSSVIAIVSICLTR